MGQTGIPADATWVRIDGVVPGYNAVLVGGHYCSMQDLLDGWVWTMEPRVEKPVENPCGVKVA